MIHVLGIIVGVISGTVWEFISTTPSQEHRTLVSSIFVNTSNKTFHFHHWLIYLGVIVLVLVWAIRTDKFLHPSVLMILSFLTSAIAFNFIKNPDWYIFFK